jgi:predicted O-linked N-acetylglucosamine transferase (SPINDLY family)
VAASLLHAVGLPELVVADDEDYVALARDLALDAARLAELRARLTDYRRSRPLFDAGRFARDLGRLYAEMYATARDDGRQPIALDPSVSLA